MQTEVLGIINCCTGQPVSLGERVEQFIRERDCPSRRNTAPSPTGPTIPPACGAIPEKFSRL